MQQAEFIEALHTDPASALASFDQLYANKELLLTDAVSCLCEFISNQEKNSVFRKQALFTLTRLVSSTSAAELVLHEAVLLPTLITSLDANVPDVSTALRLLWVNDCLGAEHALRQCGLAHSDSVIRLASINELSTWIEHVNGRFAFRRFTPFFVNLLRDPDSSVRAAAYTQIVMFFKSAKLPAKQDLQKCMQQADVSMDLQEKILRIVGLNPVTGLEFVQPQQPQRAPFRSQKSSLEKQELATNLGRKIRPHSDPSVKGTSPAHSPSPTKPLNSPRTPSSPSSPNKSYMDRAMKFEIMNSKMYAIQPLSAQFAVFSYPELDQFVEKSLKCFEGKETDANWDVRLRTVQKLRSALHKADWITGSELRELMRRLGSPLLDVLGSMRTTLVAETIYFVKETAQIHSEVSGQYYNDTFDQFFDVLAKIAGGVKKITASLAHIAICSLLISGNTVSNRVFQVIMTECKSIKGFQQVHALYWLKLVILTSYSRCNTLADRQSAITKTVISCLQGADNSTRSAARNLFWDIRRLWPEANEVITAAVNQNVVRLMETENSRKPSSRIPLRKPVSLACMTGPSSSLDQRPETPVVITEKPAFAPSRPRTSLGLRLDSAPTFSPILANGVLDSDKPPPSKISSNIHSEFGYGPTISLSSSIHPSDFPVDVPSNLLISGKSERSGPVERTPVESPLLEPVVNEVGAVHSKSDSSASAHSSDTSRSTHASNQSQSFISNLRESSLNQSIADLSMRDISEPDILSKEYLLNAARSDLPTLFRKLAVDNLDLAKLRFVFDTLESCHVDIPSLVSSPNVFITEEEVKGSKRLTQVYYTCQSPVKRGDANENLLHVSSEVSTGPVGLTTDKPLTFSELPTTEEECVEHFTRLVRGLETFSSTNAELAVLTVLTTALTTNQDLSTIELPVSIWKEKYSSSLPGLVVPYIMGIDDSRLQTALVLLKTVIRSSTEVSVDELFSAMQKCVNANLSPAVKKVFLPELSLMLLNQNPKLHSEAFIKLVSSSPNNDGMLYLKVKIVAQVCAASGPEFLVYSEECSNLLQTAIVHEDVSVRKEVYPLLIKVHEHSQSGLFQQVQTKMSQGQQRLLDYYLHNQLSLT